VTERTTLQSCCVDAYSSEAVRWLVGDSLHPGGPALTERLAHSLGLGPSSTVVDVACGRGTSALAVAAAFGCAVVGVDLAEESLADARARADGAGLSERVRFLAGDAEELPLPDQSVDAVLCECALCLFHDRPRAAAELARVLRPGGRLALSDVTADAEALPPELRTLVARVACIAGAEPLAETARLLEDAGFVVDRTEEHRDALVELVDRVEARLRFARLIADRLPAALAGHVAQGLEIVAAARGAIDAGTLGYAAVYGLRRPTADA